MHLVLDALLAFLLLGITEAVIKPIAKRWVQRRVLRHAPTVLQHLDQLFPALVGQLNAAELEDYVRTYVEDLTGESWRSPEIDTIFRLFDPRVTAERNARNQ